MIVRNRICLDFGCCRSHFSFIFAALHPLMRICKLPYIFLQIQIQKPCTRQYIGRKSYCTHYSLQWRFTASYQPESRVPPLVKEASSHIPPFILLTSLCMYSAHVVRGRPTARLPPGCRGVTVLGSNTAWCKREDCGAAAALPKSFNCFSSSKLIIYLARFQIKDLA